MHPRQRHARVAHDGLSHVLLGKEQAGVHLQRGSGGGWGVCIGGAAGWSLSEWQGDLQTHRHDQRAGVDAPAVPSACKEACQLTIALAPRAARECVRVRAQARSVHAHLLPQLGVADERLLGVALDHDIAAAVGRRHQVHSAPLAVDKDVPWVCAIQRVPAARGIKEWDGGVARWVFNPWGRLSWASAAIHAHGGPVNMDC